jgi:hypothetical protein
MHKCGCAVDARYAVTWALPSRGPFVYAGSACLRPSMKCGMPRADSGVAADSIFCFLSLTGKVAVIFDSVGFLLACWHSGSEPICRKYGQ